MVICSHACDSTGVGELWYKRSPEAASVSEYAIDLSEIAPIISKCKFCQL